MERFGWIIGVIVAVYVAVCFVNIAAKHGKNPVLYGMLSLIAPVNRILLGYWTFSDGKTQDKPNMTSHS